MSLSVKPEGSKSQVSYSEHERKIAEKIQYPLAVLNLPRVERDGAKFLQEEEQTESPKIILPTIKDADGLMKGLLEAFNEAKRQENEKLIKNIKEKYGITVHLGDNTPKEGIKCSGTGDLDQVNKALHELDKALSIYPHPAKVLFHNIGLSDIYLAEEVTHSGHEVGGVAISKKGIVISMGTDHRDITSTVHHEIFHALDDADLVIKFSDLNNVVWQRRRQGLIYQYNNGIDAIKADPVNIGSSQDRPKGFARKYGQAGGPDEDQATFAEIVMSGQSQKFLDSIKKQENRSEEDINQDLKLCEEAIQMVKELYYKMSKGYMNKYYWDKLESAAEAAK